MTVMDVLDYIRDNFSHSLSYRWFCGVKKCGFCAMTVNGRPVLSCWEPASEKMQIEPLRNFPVVRDLVIDRSKYDAIMNEFKLQQVRKNPYPGFPEPLKHEEMKATFHAWDCIECMVCMAACTVLGRQNFKDTPAFSGFMGPAPLVQLARYELDPRDGGNRFDLLAKGRIEDCGSCNDCGNACPKEIDVLGIAIDGLRAKMVETGRYYIKGWNLIRRVPRSIRRLTKCTLNLSLGEGWKAERTKNRPQ
jgi:fumarate reductase (CoM/CoB) subunit B